jgi:hypothetical protein
MHDGAVVSDLKPFNPDTLCPKCDFSADAKSMQHNGIWGGYNRIKRTCRRCQYSWDEAPLDYDAEAEAEAVEASRKQWLAAMWMYPTVEAPK